MFNFTATAAHNLATAFAGWDRALRNRRNAVAGEQDMRHDLAVTATARKDATLASERAFAAEINRIRITRILGN